MSLTPSVVATLELIIAIGFVGFWVYFFLVENKNPENTPVYLAFERSFPVPDLGWLTPGLIAAAIGLWTGQTYGIVLTIAVGGAMLFLGLLDTSFNVQNGGYTKTAMDTVMNLFINAVCVVMGPVFIIAGANMI